MLRYSNPALVCLCSAFLSAGAPASVRAEIKLHDSFTASGFVSGSSTLDDADPGTSTDHFGLDDALLSFQAASGPVAATFGVYHEPGATKETKLHDLFLTYDAGRGLAVTVGKFQSMIGYEAYYAVDNPTISFANNELITIAPGYHSGLKLEYTGDTWSVGGALLDSLYTGANDARGDGELRHNQGYEAFVAFRSGRLLEIAVSAGHEGRGVATNESFLYDVWATCQFTPSTLLAANWSGKDGGAGDTGHAWLTLLKHDFTGRISASLRASGDRLQGGERFTRFTIAPSYRVTPVLTVRAEYSHTERSQGPPAATSFYGVQAFVRF
jgi:hypothetical protein